MMRDPEERRAAILESILCCFVDHERAGAIVGDLMEAHVDHPPSRFYRVSVQLILSVALRTSAWWIGSVAAGFGIFMAAVRLPGLWHFSYIRTWQNPSNRWFVHFAHHYNRTFQFFQLSHGFFSLPFLCAGAVLFWRYGYRSRIAQLAAILFLSGIPFIYYPSGLVWVMGILVMVGVIFAATFAPNWRKPFFILMASTVPTCILYYAGIMVLFASFGSHISYLQTMFGCLLMVCSAGAFCVVCFWLQNRFLPETRVRREVA